MLTCIIPKGHIVFPSGSEVIAQVVTSGASTENACVALILMSIMTQWIYNWSSFSSQLMKILSKLQYLGLIYRFFGRKIRIQWLNPESCIAT